MAAVPAARVAAVVPAAAPAPDAAGAETDNPSQPMIERFKDPFFFQWHVTDRCNLNCAHCYRDESRSDLPWNDLLRILDNIKEFKAFLGKPCRVQFAGGEPLLRDDLPDLVEAVEKAGMPTRILSSGVLLTPEKADRLKAAGLGIVQISIEGNQETHDSIRGRGNYDKALAGAAAASSAGLEVTFSMTLSRRNQAEAEHVFQAASAHADRVGFHRLVVAGNAKAMKDDMLSPREWKSVLRRVYAMKKKGSIDVPYRDPTWNAFLISRFFPFIPRGVVSGCSAGYNQITIESDGDVFPCRRLPISVGNALVQRLVEIWRDSQVIARLRDRSLLKGKCGRCRLKFLCGGCRAIPFAMNGDFLAEDPQCFR